MPLPILNIPAGAASEQTLIRYYHQLESKWSEHLAESGALDFGTAWANPDLPRVFEANRMLDVALPEGMPPQEALEQAEAFYAEKRATCWMWVMNPSAPSEQTEPMVQLLTQRGYARQTGDIMYLDRLPSSLPSAPEPLKIFPARASFKHSRMLHEENAREWQAEGWADAGMLHLDDPHYDALIAMKDGAPAAHIGVLAMGEIGLIEQVFVSSPLRRRGIGMTMMGRALEICARSLFKHVFLGVASDAAEAIRLYERCGFRKIGQFVTYQRPE